VLAKELRSASLNVQKQCPPYKKDLLIAGLPQTLDAPDKQDYFYTTWKVSDSFGVANPHFFVLEQKNGLF